MDSGVNTASYSAANYFIEGLNEIGIEYLFSNMGTDHAPIIEALAGRSAARAAGCRRSSFARTRTRRRTWPAAMRWRPAAARACWCMSTSARPTPSNAMHNLYRSRIPVLLMAGKAPFTAHGELTGTRDNYVHFVQEPFDQGSLVRPYMKWEWTLPSGVVVKEALRRAHTVMQSEPKGPVYLMLPREILTEVWSDQDMRVLSRRALRQHANRAAPIRKLVERLADALLAAKDPMLITSYGGRTPGTSDAIERLAEFAGIRVFESNMVNNISHEGPCFSGFAAGPHVAQTDFGLLVDVDVPWFPRDSKANDADVLGADRRRRAQGRLADVELPEPSAPARQQRAHPRAAA